MCQISTNSESIFNFETNLRLTGTKYLIKVFFDIKIEIGMHSLLYKHKLYKHNQAGKALKIKHILSII